MLGNPSKRLVRGTKRKSAIFGFGDANDGGFGSSWKNGEKIRYCQSVWGDEMEGSSSNHQELENLVDSLEQMAKDETLEGVEVFMFTHNSTAENAFFNRSSKSRKLFVLVLRLHKCWHPYV